MAVIAQASQPPHFGGTRHEMWDEAIVPTLRRRLEEESIVLSKRMSIQSMLSQADHPRRDTIAPTQINFTPQDQETKFVMDSQHFSRQNTVIEKDNVSTASKPSGSKPPTFQRARTYSTPYPFERGSSGSGHDAIYPPTSQPSTGYRAASNGKTTPESARAKSPSVYPPSRIPMPTGRSRADSRASRSTTPTNIKVGAGRATNGHDFTSPDSMRRDPLSELGVLPEATFQKPEQIRDEEPPFHAGSLVSLDRDFGSYIKEPSLDEKEEEPQYEHWYRGEGRDGGGRNGGRGEIRAGTREMLEIAAGGHRNLDSSRNRWSGGARDGSFEDIDEVFDYGLSREPSRQQWPGEAVLDELPLTDLEAEGDWSDAEVRDSPSDPPAAPSNPIPSLPPPPLPQTVTSAPPTPRVPPTKLPTPRKSTPAPALSSHPPITTSKSYSTPSSSTNRKTTPTKPGAATGSRHRIPTSVSTATKRVRKKSSPAAPRSRPNLDTNPYASSLADAIPPWSQNETMPRSGNWDEVVLPTVAKKMRLANGESESDITMMSTPKKALAQFVPPPAPGTFGYDPSKIRGASRLNGDILEMHEFGVREEEEISEPAAPSQGPVKPPSPKPVETAFPIPRASSPAPFSRYANPNPSEPDIPPVSAKDMQKELRKNKPAITVTSPSVASPRRQSALVDEENVSSGCCGKCIVM